MRRPLIALCAALSLLACTLSAPSQMALLNSQLPTATPTLVYTPTPPRVGYAPPRDPSLHTLRAQVQTTV